MAERVIAFKVRGLVRGRKSGPKRSGVVWLSWTDEAGGWYQWTHHEPWAKIFTDKLAAERAVDACPGPWFSIPEKRTIRLVEGFYTAPQPERFEPLSNKRRMRCG